MGFLTKNEKKYKVGGYIGGMDPEERRGKRIGDEYNETTLYEILKHTHTHKNTQVHTSTHTASCDDSQSHILFALVSHHCLHLFPLSLFLQGSYAFIVSKPQPLIRLTFKYLFMCLLPALQSYSQVAVPLATVLILLPYLIFHHSPQNTPSS